MGCKIIEPLHSPDGKKRGGADAVSLGGPLVMHPVMSDNHTLGCMLFNRR